MWESRKERASERSSAEEGDVGLNRLAPGPVPYSPVPTVGLFCQAGCRIIVAPSPVFRCEILLPPERGQHAQGPQILVVQGGCYMYIQIYIYIYMYVYMYILVQIHIYIYKHTYMCIHIYIYIYTYMYIHI